MSSEEAFKNYFDFFLMAQREGMESATRFWSLSPEKNTLLPNALEAYERFIDWQMALGFVQRHKYDQALRENEELRQENRSLKDAIQYLQFNIFKEGGEKMQDAWRELLDRQCDMPREMEKNFLEFFRQLQESGR